MSSQDPAKNDLSCDVLIVGGGPAGLATAETLSPHAKVIVVHQDREIGWPVRTSGGTFVEDMEALGVPAHLYREMEEIAFVSDNVTALHPMPDNPVAVLDVTGLYRWLAARAEANGATILTGHKFLSSQPSGAGHVSTIRRSGAEPLHIRSRYIVDASGTPCAVLADLGLVQRATRQGVGIEHEYDLLEGPSRRATLFVGACVPSGYGWIFPAPGGTVRIGAGVIQPDTDKSPRDVLEPILTQAFLKQHGLKLGALKHVNAGVVPSVPYAHKLVFGTVIRVGDSANFATPTVGEGIRICIALGRVLGHELTETLQSGSSKPLQRYETACRKALARNYKLGFLANKRAARYGAADWDRSVARTRRMTEDEFAMLLRSEFDLRMILVALARHVWIKLRGRLGR